MLSKYSSVADCTEKHLPAWLRDVGDRGEPAEGCETPEVAACDERMFRSVDFQRNQSKESNRTWQQLADRVKSISSRTDTRARERSDELVR